MKTQSVQKPKIDFAKIKLAKVRLGSVMKTTNDSLTKLTAQGPITSASPEDVAKALTEAAVPAMEEVLSVINDIVEALPVEEGEGLGDGLGDDGGIGDGNGNDDDPLHEGVNENVEGQNGGGDDPRIKDLEEKTASLLKENINMKKASLAKRLGNTFPGNMRRAAEDEFLKENEEEDDLDILEARVAMAEKVVKGYHDANMINRSKTTQYGNQYLQTAKVNGGKLRTAKGDQEIPWQMRT